MNMIEAKRALAINRAGWDRVAPSFHGGTARYLAERGARELWGVDLSPVQIGFAEETLRAFKSRCHLFESPMEVNPGVPLGQIPAQRSSYSNNRIQRLD